MGPLRVVSSKALSRRNADVDLTTAPLAVVVAMKSRVGRAGDGVETAVRPLSADLTRGGVEGRPSRVVDVPDAQADDTTVSSGCGEVCSK
jgi:hypothetical protein